jgi:hypothetical protein
VRRFFAASNANRGGRFHSRALYSCDCPVGFDDRESIRYTAALDGQVAQLVEQRTENPRVRGSIPRLATMKKI